jgi:hypothetical protein
MMKTNKKDRMNEQIRKHGEDLNKIFNLNEDPDKLSRRVHRLEVKAHRLSTARCNGQIDGRDYDVLTDKILKSLKKVLSMNDTYQPQCTIPIFVNGDARGYALKIKDDYVREHDLKIHKDWGGYGILAPEFDGTN